ncbi:concanavalin A-like lectin/glucanase domain-containing protein [Kickxella alabastrina]|uniref:concanavalin A-like lectin/glucanase domain-containing protein n=1 Tax=Kickxella alabastrina TaxID=61397 RepID=UPI002220593E|nr:concanavalin A-like lectin/glucanase domain-containing protein [Kickxella alabastrina]KAI7826785.1 concanavalin A-like lectin/glucanase domain-containing protein [Kickxella alabastrina]
MKVLTLVGLASLLVSHALAACSGMNVADSGTCPTMQCQAINNNFSNPTVLASAESYSATPNSNATFVSEQTPDFAAVDRENLVLSLRRSASANTASYVGSTVYFTRWIHYGVITAMIKSGSTTAGVVSSFQLQDDSGSSIDFDWVGISTNRVQANYYTNSQVQLSGAVAPILAANPINTFVEYKIVWLPDSLTWYANGFAVRSVKRKDTWAEGEQKYNYPSKPARLSFSIWDASKSINPSMTQSWAGTIQSTSPQFDMVIKSVTVNCYNNGTGLTNTPHNSNALASGSVALSNQQQGASLVASSKTVSANNGLANFGQSSEEDDDRDSLEDEHSSLLTKSAAPADDLSKWLAGLNASTTSASWRVQSCGRVVSLLIACSVAFVSSI